VTAADSVSILPVVARKPRSWGESPLCGDFPGPVREALDAMNDLNRGRLLKNLAASSESHGFAATVQACRVIIESGRELSSTSINQTARRIGQGDGGPHGPDLTRYDRFMKERTHDRQTLQEPASRPRGGRTVSKSTVEEVMELSRNLPLTRSVLKTTTQDTMPGQLGLLAGLFRAENLSREQSKRLRLLKQDNRLNRELDRIVRSRLRIIDELGYLPIDIDGARLLLQVIADSYEKRSIIFTSNLEFSWWGDVFGDGDMTVAIIDTSSTTAGLFASMANPTAAPPTH
jgi:hypothetical protein